MGTDRCREGEETLDFDPAGKVDATLHFIGHVETPWKKGDCPRNIQEARKRGGRFRAVVAPGFRRGLAGLAAGDALILLYWMADARRDLIVQAPPHRAEPTGTFALRSPNRPNTVSLGVTRILSIDTEAGVIEVDALDAFDGTPLIDIKPWLATVDIPDGA
ncbi:MAG: TrmO family methyltransferase [Jhaorihella sp.]